MREQDRVAELEAEVGRLEGELVQAQRLRRDAVAARDVQTTKLKATRAELERLRRRRAVRVALAFSRIVEPVTRVIGGRRRRQASVAPTGPGGDAARRDVDPPGPGPFRKAVLDALSGDERSSSEELHVLVSDHTVDVRDLPSHLITIASIDSDAERWVAQPWVNDYDIVLVGDEATASLVRARTSKAPTVVRGELTTDTVREVITGWASATRYGVRIGPPNRAAMEHWGDYHFARGLQRSLERIGHPTRVHILPEWGGPVAARDDVSIHLFGRSEAPIRRDQVNLLWQVSHPDLASAEMYERYDHVFVASDRFAARMAEKARTPVTALHQATDPDRFRPDPTGPAHDLLFVGNSRFVRRRIVDDVVAAGHDIAIYGADWRPDLVDARFVKGENIPNAELNRYYSSAAIVLNDHWADMVAEGFISNRLYDAFACGAFLISDYLPEFDAEFDGAVVSYTDPAELGPLIDRYLADPEARRTHADRGRAAVLARHTFDQRAVVLRDVVEPLLPIARSR